MLAFIFEIVTALFSLQEGKNESLFSRERIVGGEWGVSAKFSESRTPPFISMRLNYLPAGTWYFKYVLGGLTAL